MKKTMKMISKAVMALVLAAGVASVSGNVQADSFALGNCSENILNGGVINRTNDGEVYFADTENGDCLCVMDGDYNVTVLSGHSASDINVIEDNIYYVTDQGTAVMCLNRSNGEETALFTVEEGIDEMYVTSDGEVYYLSGGDVYKRALPDEELTEDTASETEAEDNGEEDPAAQAEPEEVTVSEEEEAEAEDAADVIESDPADNADAAAEQADGEAEAVVSDEEVPAEEMTETEAAETEADETEAAETAEDVTITEEPEVNVTENEADVTGTSAADEAEQECEPIESESGTIIHFIPTAYGLVYAKGSALNYDLYADGDEIAADVTSFYDADGYLIMNCDGDDRQAKISALFSGDAAAQVEEYSLGSSLEASGSGSDDGECEECEANAAAADSGDVEDDWALGEQTWEMLTDEDGASDEDVTLEASGASTTTSILYDSSVSESQRNMVRRAYQMHLIEWTPLANITGWGGSYTYTKGTTYTGLPYGQPVNVSGYVPWNHTLEEFVSAVNNLSSKMYTSYSSYNKRAPYYSTDCSGFVSWAWDLSNRTWTSAFYSYANKVSNQSIYSVEIGDAFCKSGSHVVMVSDIGYKDGEIVYIDIIEETPPITKLTRYGEGGSKTLAAMSEKYLGKGYILYRSKTRDDVTYTPSKAVLLEDESAGDIKLDTVALDLDIGESYKVTYETDASGVTYWSTSDKNVATVDNDGNVKGVGTGEATITLHVGPTKAEVAVKVMPAKVELVSASAIRTGGITIKWNEVPGSTYYIVFRKNSAGTWNALSTVTDALSYSDTSTALKNHTSYTYTVRAYYKMSDGTLLKGDYDSKGISCTTVTATPELTSLKAVDYQSQLLTWKAVDGAEGYHVYRKTGSESWKDIGTTEDTSYRSTGLSIGTAYRYTVRAYFTENGKQILSNYNSTGLQRYCAPAVPKLTSLTAVSDTSQKITWEAVEGVDAYRIFRKTGSSAWEKLGDTAGTSYTVSGLKLGTSYTYTVRAYKTVGGTDFLSGYDATGLTKVCCAATPVLRAVKTTGVEKQTVAWRSVSGAAGYVLYVKEAGASKWTTLAKTTDTSFEVSGREVGVKYTYTVRAYSKVGSSNILSGYDADGISAVCLPYIPVLKSVSAVNTTSQKVAWGAVEGAEGYCVYYKSGSGKWTLAGKTDKTDYTVEGLTVGTKYTYTVRAYITVDGKLTQGGYNTAGVSKVCCPATPVLSSLTASSYTSQRLTWKAVEGAEKYRVFVKAGTSKNWTVLGDTENTYWAAKKLTCGTKYTYTVRAIAMAGDTEVLSGYNTSGIGKVCVPADPVLGTASIAGYGKIKVTWKSVSGANSYNVYRKTASSSWVLAGNTKNLTFTDSDLTLNTEYIYTVRAVRIVGTKSVLSGYNAAGVSCMMKLEAPVLKSAVSEAEGNVTVSWEAVSGAESYRVYYKEEGGNWLQLGTVGADQTSLTSDILESGKTYTFTVKALWTSGKTVKGSAYDTVGVSCEIQ